MKSFESTKIRIWDCERKEYCNGIPPAGKCEIEFFTGLYDRNGKEIFWHDRIAVFFGAHDRLLGFYDVDETFVRSFLYKKEHEYLFSLGFQCSKYFLEVVGNSHFEDKQKIKKFLKGTLKYE